MTKCEEFNMVKFVEYYIKEINKKVNSMRSDIDFLGTKIDENKFFLSMLEDIRTKAKEHEENTNEK